jgi:multidrug resistance efflux pump
MDELGSSSHRFKELNFRYCDIVAKIDGVVTRQNVNPRDYVQIGQNLMRSARSNDIWVDANFKQTELRYDLCIGLPGLFLRVVV